MKFFASFLCSVLLLLPFQSSFGYATSPNEVLENWQLNDLAGTSFDQVTNTAGSAHWNTGRVSTDGAGSLVINQAGGDLWHRSATLPVELSSGLYEVEWKVNVIDLSHSSASDNCGSTVDLGGTLNVRLFAHGSDKLGITAVGGPDGWNLVHDFDTRVLSNLTIRTLYNTIQHTAEVYYRLGSAAEQGPFNYAINDISVSSLKGSFLGNKMATADFEKIDYITLTVIDIDSDDDGILNSDDPDDDNDGYDDTVDVFPLDPTEWVDADGNGVGDNVQFDQSILMNFTRSLA
jgi:hypothetical protein